PSVSKRFGTSIDFGDIHEPSNLGHPLKNGMAGGGAFGGMAPFVRFISANGDPAGHAARSSVRADSPGRILSAPRKTRFRDIQNSRGILIPPLFQEHPPPLVDVPKSWMAAFGGCPQFAKSWMSPIRRYGHRSGTLPRHVY